MKIRVNGIEREIEAGTTVESLLNMLEIKVQGIAVDINREIVPKRLFSETILNEGDSIEIVRMVGGG
ncbi:MAG: sulfur carrier protein ThiS [Deltaproteobacteria bacterium]|nr:sulfur carrier protein ThiS [Deltaproteobacteria bacterium]